MPEPSPVVECQHHDSDVKDSRPTTCYGFPSIRRRRHCKSCGHRFTTYELSDMHMIKARLQIAESEIIRNVSVSLKTAMDNVVESIFAPEVENLGPNKK